MCYLGNSIISQEMLHYEKLMIKVYASIVDKFRGVNTEKFKNLLVDLFLPVKTNCHRLK
jgi:hypothetical protein